MLMWRLVVTEVHDNIRTYLKKKKDRDYENYRNKKPHVIHSFKMYAFYETVNFVLYLHLCVSVGAFHQRLVHFYSI